MSALESPGTQSLQVEFCDFWTTVDPPGPFRIGRDGDLAIPDDPYLHRTFLELSFDRAWWLTNNGSRLSATVSDAAGSMHAWLAPGASIPLVFPVTEVRFSAGPTSYLASVHLPGAPLAPAPKSISSTSATTLLPVRLSENQRLVVIALAEPALRDTGNGAAELPSNAAAARRLGWTLTRFNRQLDTVCDKLSRSGIRGLHGQVGELASARRARLVEYALAVRLVAADDLPLLGNVPG
jgi:hypothetical protein